MSAFEDEVFVRLGAHGSVDGRIRIGQAIAIPLKGGQWRYSYPPNRFMSTTELRREIMAALTEAGPGHRLYRLSVRHAIVLYPDFITFDNFRNMEALGGSGLEDITYRLTARLPCADGALHEVTVIIPTLQSEPLIVRD